MAYSTARRDRLPKDWKKRRAIVMARDKGQCQMVLDDGTWCPNKGTDVDHRIAGDNHTIENLQLLCRRCHFKKSETEKLAAIARMPRMKRPPEPHPGLIR